MSAFLNDENSRSVPDIAERLRRTIPVSVPGTAQRLRRMIHYENSIPKQPLSRCKLYLRRWMIVFDSAE
eukprot:2711142-Rhodomonas_salina.6